MVDHSKKVVNPPPPVPPDVLPSPVTQAAATATATKKNGSFTIFTPITTTQKTGDRSQKTDCGDRPFEKQQKVRKDRSGKAGRK